jgi:hypothetical protein
MTDTSHKNFRIIKYIAAILLPISIISTAVSWYLSEKLRPSITAELKGLVYTATDSLYRIEFSTIRTNWITGNASLYDVNIIPDTMVLKRQNRRLVGPNNVYTIRVKRLMIRGFHPWTLYRKNKLHINELLFIKPDITMANKQLPFNENKPPRPRSNPYAYISKYLAELRVSNINLRDIKFKYINNNQALPVADSLSNLNITLKDWLIDSTSAEDPKRLYLLKDVVLNLNDYAYATPDSLYHIKMKKLEFRASTGRLKIDQFGVVPKYPEMEFGQQAGYAKDRYNLSLNQISLSGINFPLYLSTQELFAKDMNIDNGFLAVFNNNELPGKGLPKRGKFPHQLLQTLRGVVTVQKLKLNNIDISYSEYDKESKEKGILTFQNTRGEINNLTNSPKYKKINPVMGANLHSQFMDKGNLDINFKFHLIADNGFFSYQGSLKNMDGRILNKVTRPLGMLQIKSGFVDELSFNIRANENISAGTLDFRYHNLGVRILERAKDSERLVKKGWISFLANNLIINSANPGRDGKFVRAKINYTRAPTASFFSFLYKTLFQGIRHSIGFTAEKEREIKSQIEKFEKMKADRDERRENRKRRFR